MSYGYNYFPLAATTLQTYLKKLKDVKKHFGYIRVKRLLFTATRIDKDIYRPERSVLYRPAMSPQQKKQTTGKQPLIFNR